MVCNNKLINRITLFVLILSLLGCSKDSELFKTEENYQVQSRSLQCNAPKNVSVTNILPNSISLKWSKENTALKYRVEWTSLASGVWIYRDTPDTLYTIPGLSAGHTYRIRVKSLCQGWVNDVFYGVSSTPSSELEITTINNTGTCVDMYEYNDHSGVSKPISFNKPIEGKITKPQTTTDKKGNTLSFPDTDWFRFFTDGKFVVELYNLPANYDLEIYRTVNGSSKNIILVASSKNTSLTSEKITITDFFKYERYYIRVYGVNSFDDNKCYTLKLNIF